jgi:hypothetical protein
MDIRYNIPDKHTVAERLKVKFDNMQAQMKKFISDIINAHFIDKNWKRLHFLLNSLFLVRKEILRIKVITSLYK